MSAMDYYDETAEEAAWSAWREERPEAIHLPTTQEGYPDIYIITEHGLRKESCLEYQ